MGGVRNVMKQQQGLTFRDTVGRPNHWAEIELLDRAQIYWRVLSSWPVIAMKLTKREKRETANKEIKQETVRECKKKKVVEVRA